MASTLTASKPGPRSRAAPAHRSGGIEQLNVDGQHVASPLEHEPKRAGCGVKSGTETEFHVLMALAAAGSAEHRGERERTPVMTVRVSRASRAALEEIASAQGRRLADISREALDEYIRRHAS